MKFNTVIIGGGLSGLTAGIALAEAGQRVAIVSSGQSALHFSSGSMDLLGYDAEHRPLSNPLEGMAALPETHPYTRVGIERIRTMLPRVEKMFKDSGVLTEGTSHVNHWHLTPLGEFKPAWLSLTDYPALSSPDAFPYKKVVVVGIDGFLDFYPRFITAGLRRHGVECNEDTVTVEAIEHQRVSSSEMRAANVGRILHGKAIEELGKKLNNVDPAAEAVLFPAVVGMDNTDEMQQLRALVNRPLLFVGTMGASVPGIRTQIMLRKHFCKLGGIYMLGDSAKSGQWSQDGKSLLNIETVNFGADRLEADNFIFAAGSFFSHGLDSNINGIFEPVFGLDTVADEQRGKWFDGDIFKPQPFMKYGLATDASMRAMRAGSVVNNIYVAGSSLAGADALTEGSGAGIATLTALAVADKILNP